ncbi:flavodoxin [Furfurilactobacillus milii]|uniref:Flavodoxin n=1 Tax=Furfurilactobacillus milii TaxID=2888272 RepID=A0A6N9I0C0_9LACO|nr:flavodoxin [Furfurilactobacillus milii]MYV16370.1 flavodoxin [Furfurilactobacillus milii]
MNAHVVYATITGNNEDVADIITEAFEELNIPAKESEISQTDVDDFAKADILVIVPYTYDEGALPEEGLDFFDDLSDIKLRGKIFGVAGSGDVFYGDDYGVAVDRFNDQMLKTGAKMGANPLKINLSPDADDIKKLDQFVKEIVTSAKA